MACAHKSAASIARRQYGAKFDVSGMNIFLNAISGCAEQWEYAHLDHPYFFNLNQSFNSPRFPHLKTVSVKVQSANHEIGNNPILSRHVSQLCHIFLEGFYNLDLPLRQLVKAGVSRSLETLKHHQDITHFTS